MTGEPDRNDWIAREGNREGGQPQGRATAREGNRKGCPYGFWRGFGQVRGDLEGLIFSRSLLIVSWVFSSGLSRRCLLKSLSCMSIAPSAQSM